MPVLATETPTKNPAAHSLACRLSFRFAFISLVLRAQEAGGEGVSTKSNTFLYCTSFQMIT